MGTFLYRIHDFLALIKVLSLPRIVNYLKLYLSYWYTRTGFGFIKAGKPATFSFEPIASCNLQCPECPAGLHELTRNQGMASYELFHTVLKALAPNAFYTTIYFQGEPLLHPHFEEFVRMAKEHKLYTATSTNAHFLDEVNAQALVIAGLNRLIISLDGLDQKTYEKYRRGGDLQKVTEGIKTIRRARTELKALTPLIVVQFIVMKHNEHQMNDVRKFAYDLGADVVELKTAQIYDMNDPNEIIPINSKYSRYNRDQNGLMHLKSSLPNHCFRVWSSTVISWDGKVLPCCYDKDGDNAYGNLSTTDFESIISSNQASGFQHRIFSGRKEIEICRNCPEK